MDTDPSAVRGVDLLREALESWWPSRSERYLKWPDPCDGNEEILAGDVGIFHLSTDAAPRFEKLGHIRDELPEIGDIDVGTMSPKYQLFPRNIFR